ncbi:Uncharacterised protein [Mycobacterium tuberculosis]|uniref:Uncharacterized protein n=1 Tax=Mycobacterium tuberculosis TaxID=1773 RepID=A0A654TI71_MYCTX|nr:Uncharacterised protein [Mycobacterium tuberculosis]COV31915.1 Uncharacterised protein [Mycobacterium tuberculosis]
MIIGRATMRSRSSSDHTMGRSPLRMSSPKATSAPVSARKILVDAVRQPDSLRSASIGFLSVRCSGPRLSWLIATTGTSSSFANSFRCRENSDTSTCRDSYFLPEVISCR